ncbi:tetratricopeptide repeat protein [Aequorivita sp. SDUM287046]|uniref:Tetratricopeptide repeat protein n=1 Tax=Aequorivita aurantiaca TaxID=3053356 RepID=A0ABT8DNF4_9FLAO|nr:tetratricopeptide repeat protein [Aequorivita aurantiaca]MDN3725410.1 tetratricopeptide repeat protein [Aequorivita aurantiaca]
MKQYALLSFLLFLCCANLPAQNGKIEKLQQQIENDLFKKPDSAKVYLFKLLEQSEALHDTVTAKTYSNLGITYNQLAVYDSAVYSFDKGIALSNGFPHTQAQIYSNLAINYRTMAEYSKSLQALEEAMKRYKALGELNGEGLVYGEMASNYNYMAKKEKAIIYLKKAIEIFKETEDPRIYILQQKLGNVYFNNGNYKFAIDIYEDVLPEFRKQKGAPYYLTLLAYAESLVETGKQKEGEEWLEEARDGLKDINNLEYMNVAIGKLGKIYAETGRPQLAEKALRDAYNYLLEVNSTRFLPVASYYLRFLNEKNDSRAALEVINNVKESTANFKQRMNAQDELGFLLYAKDTYAKAGNYATALDVFERIDFLKDSIGNAEDNVKIKQLEEVYQNEIQGEKNKALSQNNDLLKKYNSEQKSLTLLTLAFAIMFLVVSMVLYKYHRKKIKLQKDSLAQLETTNLILQENQELEQELRKEKENSLGNKERELVAMSMEVADIQNQIKDLLEASSKEDIAPELAAQIESILNQRNYWKYFKTKFVEVYPEFGYSLSEMFPVLSENDIAFCSLLKLQLTNKEIASLMGISHQSVISKKYRIKKKMNLHDNDESFEQLMRDL